MFKMRLFSGVVLVGLALVLILTGGGVLLASLLAVSLIGMYELYRTLQMEKSWLGISGYVTAVFFYGNLAYPIFSDIMLLLLASLMLLMSVYVVTYPKYRMEQVFEAFFGVFYVAIMLSYIYQTRMLARGTYIVWLIFLCSWGSDTCAYCIGVLFGRHKMSPKLSPKKSIEGAVGGAVGTMFLTLLYALILHKPLEAGPMGMFAISLIGGAGSLISMAGDLAASAIKRNYQMKDYGDLIPGHGGILDRFDSVIFTAPAIYYLAVYFVS